MTVELAVLPFLKLCCRHSDENLNVDLVGVLSTQEELGERGVKVAVGKVAPQIALCFEGCPADDTFTEP